jgi:Protein of unknown function (DUF2505)
MTHTFDGSTQAPASVDQIHAAFSSADYWLARIAASEVTTKLDSLDVDADGAVTVRISQYLGSQLLPGPVGKFVGDGLKLVQTETWTPKAGGRVDGQIGVEVSGGLGSCSAKAWLVPADDGSQLSFTGTVQVKIPLVGSSLEKTIGANLAASIPDVMRFTTTWIAGES